MNTVGRHLFVVLLLTGSFAMEAFASPPPWAPAHGYRAKQKQKHHDEASAHYYGVLQGSCNREEIATVLGGAVGGAIGRDYANDKTLGTVAGVLIGAVAGKIIGRAMDEADRRCTGHTLEYVANDQTVAWYAGDGDVQYLVTPVSTYENESSVCREFIVKRRYVDRTVQEHRNACRTAEGSWRMIN